MTITMYDLAGAEADRRFSPFCWRTRMALAHKGLSAETTITYGKLTTCEMLAKSSMGSKGNFFCRLGETVCTVADMSSSV